jgi:hypothetical protein
MTRPFRLAPNFASASLISTGPKPHRAITAKHAQPPEGLANTERRDAMKRNQLLAQGTSPPPLDVGHMSDSKLLATRDTVRSQLNGASSAPILVSPLDLGGQWATRAFQDTSAEMKRRGLSEDGSKGQPARVDDFPLPKPGSGGSVETLYANLLAAHQAQMGEARPHDGTWLGDALTVAKGRTQAQWAARPGVDVAKGTEALEARTLEAQAKAETEREVRTLTDAVRAGLPPPLSSMPDRLLAPTYEAIQAQRLQTEEWVHHGGNSQTWRTLRALTEIETALQREIRIRD